MSNNKQRHLFPGGNTSEGFYSFYKYILPQKQANRIICLKGGPGTGKSSLMKKVGAHFSNLGYSIEYHHCSSDNESLDGVVIKELNVAILDGTAPHIVDPIHPGAVDEVINLGIAFNTNSLEKNKDKIMSLTKDISKCFNRAYKFLKSAKLIHDDWSSLNNESVNYNKLLVFINELKTKILTSEYTNFGEERHLFSTAFTPNGIVSYNNTLVSDIKNLYVLKGGPGLMKTTVLKELGLEAQKQGNFVEYFHDPLIPTRIENIIIPEISTAIFTTNEINRLSYGVKSFDIKELCNQEILISNNNEIQFDKRQFDLLINKGLSCISEAHAIHDVLESYYISAMDFSIIDNIYNQIIKRIETDYISN